MGKHTNPQCLRLSKNKNWTSKFYSDSFNYSNILGQDYIIRDYVINFLSNLKMHVSKINIKRRGADVLVDIYSYNDYYTFTESFINRYSNLIKFKRFTINQGKPNFTAPCLINNLSLNRLSYNQKGSSFISHLDHSKTSKNVYSMRRLLILNLSYFLKTNVIIRNRNIMSENPILLNLFWSLTHKLRSPLPKHLSLKFICLVYHSLQYNSAMLLCRYLSVLLPRFCKKKRKSRKVNAFMYYLRKLIKLLFSNGFCDKNKIKGLKIVFKGRINGSRRKMKYVIEYGQTSVQHFEDKVSYHQEHCYTLFGVSGIKVWIISR